MGGRKCVNALKIGHLAAAGMDVFEAEPLLPESKLLNLKNVVFSPHIGSATSLTRKRMAELAVENADRRGSRIPASVVVNPS